MGPYLIGKMVGATGIEGVAGLTHDKTRPSRIAPLPAATVDRVIELTTQPPPHQATHWTAPAMAKAVDYKRHGTTTLFAALDILEGKVEVAADKAVHVAPHPQPLVTSSSKARAASGARVASSAAISSSVKSAGLMTRRSRRLRRWYSSTEISTVRSRPFRVTATGSRNAISW